MVSYGSGCPVLVDPAQYRSGTLFSAYHCRSCRCATKCERCRVSRAVGCATRPCSRGRIVLRHMILNHSTTSKATPDGVDRRTLGALSGRLSYRRPALSLSGGEALDCARSVWMWTAEKTKAAASHLVRRFFIKDSGVGLRQYRYDVVVTIYS